MKKETVISLILNKYSGDVVSKYGEPGYDTKDDMPILLANWNDVPDRVLDRIEAMGFSKEWNDEWVIDYDNSRAYRCSPDSYGWTQYYWIPENFGEVVGGEDIENDDAIQSDYVENYLINKPSHCNVFEFDLAKYGFKQADEEYENGFHPGMNDDPKKIFDGVKDKFDVIFALDGKGQFSLEFSIWLRPKAEPEPVEPDISTSEYRPNGF